MSDTRKMFAERFKEEMKKQKLSYRGLATALDKPVEWLVTVVVGNLTMSEVEAKALCQHVPFKPRDIQCITALTEPTPLDFIKPRDSRDPIIYRLYEVLMLYGGTIKELLREKGNYNISDPIFTLLKFSRENERVNMVWSAKIVRFNDNEQSDIPTLARHGVFEIIKKKKIEKGLTWEDIGKEIGMSKEWTLAALMDRMTLTEEQASKICALLDISQANYIKYLTAPPERSYATYEDCFIQQISKTEIEAKQLEKQLSKMDIAKKLGGSTEMLNDFFDGKLPIGLEQAFELRQILDLDLHKVISSQNKEDVHNISDSVLSSLYKGVDTYAATIKEMILEDFGDGIMSAVDFKLKVDLTDLNRITVFWSGKFLPYVPY